MNRSFSLLLIILPTALAAMVWAVLGAIAGALTLALVLVMFALNNLPRPDEWQPWNRQRVGRVALVLLGLMCIAWASATFMTVPCPVTLA